MLRQHEPAMLAWRRSQVEQRKEDGRYEVIGEFSKDYATTILYVADSAKDAKEYMDGIIHKENQAQTGGY